MIFQKITGLSQNIVNCQEIGKITNMLSNDFNTIENKVNFLMLTVSLPIKLIGIGAILFYRLGWITVILFILIGLTILFQVFLGKQVAKYQVEVNASKNKRIKIYNELLEGIRVIKLYGWEMAFKKIIQEIRETEMMSYIKLKFFKSVDRTNI